MCGIDPLQQEFIFPPLFGTDPVLFGAGYLEAIVPEQFQTWVIIAIDVTEQLVEKQHLECILHDDFQGLVGITMVSVFLFVDKDAHAGPLMEGVQLEKVDTPDGSVAGAIVSFQVDHQAQLFLLEKIHGGISHVLIDDASREWLDGVAGMPYRGIVFPAVDHLGIGWLYRTQLNIC